MEMFVLFYTAVLCITNKNGWSCIILQIVILRSYLNCFELLSNDEMLNFSFQNIQIFNVKTRLQNRSSITVFLIMQM